MNTKITPKIIKEHNLSKKEYQLILKILEREPNLLELGIFSVKCGVSIVLTSLPKNG